MEYEKGVYTYLYIYRSLLESEYVKLERLIVKDVNPHRLQGDVLDFYLASPINK